MTKASLLIIITKYKFVVSNKSREEVLYIYIDKKKESKYHGVIDHETIEMRTNDRRKKRNSSQLI